MSKRPRNSAAGSGDIGDDRVDFIHVGTEFSSTSSNQQHRTWDGKPRDYSRDAFKGGFSAGYHGTVGSKEGWQSTTTFVSSRGKRAERSQMRPEDFMDDEDLADIQAARSIRVTGDYRTESQEATAESVRDGIVGVLAEAFAAEFSAVRVSSGSKVGDSIMASMGWKPGQGLGPLCRVVDRYSDDPSKRLPPKPTPLRSCEPKTNTHGIGYGIAASDLPVATNEELSLDESNALPALGTLFKKRDKKLTDGVKDTGTVSKLRRQQAKSNKQRLSFGVDDDDTVNGDIVTTGTRMSKSALDMLVANTVKPIRTMPFNKVPERGSDFCHDGRQPLSGFVLVSPSESAFRYYEGPVVPESFTGVHSNSRSRWDSVPAVGSQSKLGREAGKLVTADDRAKLGIVDTPIPAIQHLIDSETARAALAGFKPYESDPEKQARYLEYLTICANSDKGSALSATTLSAAEAPEFARMAQVFKPSSVMMSRFVSSSTAATLAHPQASSSKTEQANDSKPVARRVDATRTTLEWTPAKLLCKRMNIQPPALTLASGRNERVEKDGSTKLRRARAADFILWDGPEGSITPTVLANDTLSTSQLGNMALAQKPDFSLFQSIFGDSE
ncbi:hypothetical protein GGI03_000303 [Coemansia sp. RSA 2337]|nr:hypothetical protein H4S03_007266 [Coemansia sp. S3946]KAJ2046809.1 hypothetical protein H4S04_004825 [Coemansia sp. S16]KAJ2469546.1 hypothetical protein GGI03_000303 [Coemansia sp. RSA 2337]